MHYLRISIIAFCVSASVSCDDTKTSVIVVDAADAPAAGPDAGAESMPASKREMLCAAADAWAEDATARAGLKATLCRFTGFFAGALAVSTTSYGLQAACAAARNDCLADDSSATPIEAMCDLPANCEVEASELRTCMGDWIETLRVAASSFHGCETLVMPDFEAGRLQKITADLHARPPSCALVESKCPNFLQ